MSKDADQKFSSIASLRTALHHKVWVLEGNKALYCAGGVRDGDGYRFHIQEKQMVHMQDATLHHHGTDSIFGGLVPTCYPPSEKWELCDEHKEASELHENFA